MRVGLDARALAAPVRSGVERYVVDLSRAVAQLEQRPEIIAYVDRPVRDAELSRALANRIVVKVVRARRGWLRAALPWRLWRDRVDLVHLPSTILPPLLPCPAVVTVHDLAWRRFPETYAADDLAMQTVAGFRSVARAAHVIAVSQTTARDLTELLQVPKEKITVTPLGVSPSFTADGPPLSAEAFAGAERLGRGYVLYTGGLLPRKNLMRLLDAYDRVRREMDTPPLVLPGGDSVHAGELAERASELGLEEQVIFPGYIEEGQLPALYRGATVFVYPSLYEGFGLPVLEAMASGAPVITSDRSGTAEVAGEAAVLVDPENVEEIASALSGLLGDVALREDLAARGLVRSRSYRWDVTALETVAVYQRVAGSA